MLVVERADLQVGVDGAPVNGLDPQSLQEHVCGDLEAFGSVSKTKLPTSTEPNFEEREGA